jgi:hypothetical protein
LSSSGWEVENSAWRDACLWWSSGGLAGVVEKKRFHKSPKTLMAISQLSLCGSGVRWLDTALLFANGTLLKQAISFP